MAPGVDAAVGLVHVRLGHEDALAGELVPEVPEVVADPPQAEAVLAGLELVEAHPLVDGALGALAVGEVVGDSALGDDLPCLVHRPLLLQVEG